MEKNEVENSFMETHRLKIHKEKSVVIHVSKPKKFSTPYPELKVHGDTMHEAGKKNKYLGNYLSSTGGVKERIQDWIKEGLEQSCPDPRDPRERERESEI